MLLCTAKAPLAPAGGMTGVAGVPLPAHCEVRLYDTAPVLKVEARASSNAATVTSSRLNLPAR
jgi:hypothetical protein